MYVFLFFPRFESAGWQAAGTIHTDFERGFICAEVMHYEELKELGSENAVKAAGKYRCGPPPSHHSFSTLMHSMSARARCHGPCPNWKLPLHSSRLCPSCISMSARACVSLCMCAHCPLPCPGWELGLPGRVLAVVVQPKQALLNSGLHGCMTPKSLS